MQDKLISLSHASTNLEDLIQKANDLIRAPKAPSTRKAYQSDFRIFESWCAAHGLAFLPSAPQTIALYIASCVVARLAPATIARCLASISKAHQAAGFEDSPASTKHFVVGEVLKGAVFRGVDRHGRVAAQGVHRDSIAAIFKTAASRAGMNATNIPGHSVRAGMATQAALNGSSERALARTTRHRSRRVLRRYIRRGEMFCENA